MMLNKEQTCFKESGFSILKNGGTYNTEVEFLTNIKVTPNGNLP